MKNKIFLVIFLSFLVFYIILLLAQEGGYYKNRNEKAKVLTEEQIVSFEKDVREGKEIDIKEYVLFEDKDYTNKVSSNVYRVSLKLENVFNSAIKIVFNSASGMVSDQI